MHVRCQLLPMPCFVLLRSEISEKSFGWLGNKFKPDGSGIQARWHLEWAAGSQSSVLACLVSRAAKLYLRPKKRIRAVNARRSKLLKVRNSGESMLLLTVNAFCRLVMLSNPPRNAQEKPKA